MVGVVFYLPVTLSYKGNEYSAAFGIDMMVDKAYRRMGIATELHKIREQNFQIALSSARSETNAIVLSRMGGWNRVDNYFKFRVVIRLPKIEFTKSFVIDLISWVLFRLTLRNPFESLTAEVSTSCPKNLEQFLAHRGLSDEAHVKTDLDFCSWRYEKHPYLKYRYVEITNEKGLLGHCVLRETAPGHHRLIDCFASFQNLRSLLHALPRVLNTGRIEGQWLGVRLKKTFLKSGYLVNQTPMHALWKSTDAEVTGRFSGAKWLFYGGDSDRDR
jgi:hypothetical protein